MLRRYTRSSQNALTISANLVALVLMIAGLTVVSGWNGAWVTAAGLFVLVASSFYSWWLGRTHPRVSTDSDRPGTHPSAKPSDRE